MWLDRPLSERERGRAFALAAAFLVLAAIALSLAADRPRPDRSAARATQAVATSPPQAGTPRPSVPDASRRVLHAARRFVAGYLAYLYGRGRVSEIRASTPQLRAGLARHRPRPTPAARRRHPRIVSTRGHRLPGGGWLVTATVQDGGNEPYPVQVVVGERAGRLVVMRLGEER